MIKKVDAYTVICDNCGLDIGSVQEYSCWNDLDFAEENAIDSDWSKDGEKHYCPDCHFYNCDDEIVINSERKGKFHK